MTQGIRRKNIRKGLTFSIMVAGASGCGKTSFINTLCENNVLPPRQVPDAPNAEAEKTVEIIPKTIGK